MTKTASKNPIIVRFFQVILGLLSYNVFPSKVRIFLFRLMGVKIGKNTFIGVHVTIDSSYPKHVIIGNNCGIATGTVILAHRRDVSEYSINKGYNDYPFKVMDVVINDNVQIGTNTTILPGIVIGNGSIIGAGSVVTKDVPPHSLAVGLPAKVIKTFKD
ncbi:acyltransferase [bacterium]|nr:acyltransferase [bacterium]